MKRQYSALLEPGDVAALVVPSTPLLPHNVDRVDALLQASEAPAAISIRSTDDDEEEEEDDSHPLIQYGASGGGELEITDAQFVNDPAVVAEHGRDYVCHGAAVRLGHVTLRVREAGETSWRPLVVELGAMDHELVSEAVDGTRAAPANHRFRWVHVAKETVARNRPPPPDTTDDGDVAKVAEVTYEARVNGVLHFVTTVGEEVDHTWVARMFQPAAIAALIARGAPGGGSVNKRREEAVLATQHSVALVARLLVECARVSRSADATGPPERAAIYFVCKAGRERSRLLVCLFVLLAQLAMARQTGAAPLACTLGATDVTCLNYGLPRTANTKNAPAFRLLAEALTAAAAAPEFDLGAHIRRVWAKTDTAVAAAAHPPPSESALLMRACSACGAAGAPFACADWGWQLFCSRDCQHAYFCQFVRR